MSLVIRTDTSPTYLAVEYCASALLEGRHRQTGGLQLLPVVLGGLLVAAVDDSAAGGVDHVGDLHAALERDAGDETGERAGDMVEGVVVVVADDHPPGAPEAASRPTDPWLLERLIHARQDKARG